MATIKSMVVEKLRQKGQSVDDEMVTTIVRRHLVGICQLLPNKTPEGREFERLLSEVLPKREDCSAALLIGKPADEQIEKTINLLTEKAVDERDDLKIGGEGGMGCPALRQKLVDAINH